MRFLLISPRIAIQKGDFLGSGIPYWPVELATLAAFLREKQHEVCVADLFGSSPCRLEDKGDYYLQGRPFCEALGKEVLQAADAAIIYALSYMSHSEVLDIISFVRSSRQELKIGILENSQAVTAYALPHAAKQLFAAGANALLCGEMYWNWEDIENWFAGKDPSPVNVVTPETPDPLRVERLTDKTPSFPVPAWDLFPIENYWALPYSHGPKTRKFFPIITSRGCPHCCDFCVVPETNRQRWRGRSPENVVGEILSLKQRFGVTDFQLEDLNPSALGTRMDKIARLLIEGNAGIRFYIVSGTTAGTVKLESIPLYAQAGCRYISISPESGSAKVMKAIGKHFDYEHGKRVVEACRGNGIATQACFIVGHPAEEEEDVELSVSYLRELVRLGLDEVAVFVVAPFAGSRLFAQNRINMGPGEALISFSPKGRENYLELAQRRSRLIRVFFKEKVKKGFSLWAQGLRSLFGEPATKMENLPKRILFVYYLVIKHRLQMFFCRSKLERGIKRQAI
jgi:anaerobic magnesium-protoporphyrin IX monomethyl ester cyclase